LIGARFGHFLDRPLAPLLKAIPLSPNLLSALGFVLSAVAALVLAQELFWGGVLVLLAGTFDMLDGMVARAKGQESPFGAFLDSVLDRCSDAFLFFALAYHLRAEPLGVALSMAGLLTALLISYSRARAEALGVSCAVGLMERPERVVLLAAGAITGLIYPALWLAFLLGALTVLQRVLHTRKGLKALEKKS
jgi:phosphatidylglycerophosphate synthase